MEYYFSVVIRNKLFRCFKKKKKGTMEEEKYRDMCLNVGVLLEEILAFPYQQIYLKSLKIAPLRT